MKKSFIVLTLILSCCISACSFSSSEVANSNTDDGKFDNIVSQETNTENDPVDDKDSVSEDNVQEDNYYFGYIKNENQIDQNEDPDSTLENEKMSVAVTITNDTECYFEVIYEAQDGSKSTQGYPGSYSISDDEIKIDYLSYGDQMQAIIGIDDHMVISYDSHNLALNNGVEEIVGKYICEDSELGTLQLKIEEDGTAVLDTENNSLSGYINLYEEKHWNLMVDDYENDIYYDWIVEFEDNEFSYITYKELLYGKYAGTYDISGDLGVITVEVDKCGVASADVEIEGKKYKFTGDIYTENDKISGIYLTYKNGKKSEDYTLDLSITYVGDTNGFDSEWNYEGTLSIIKTKVLCAG